MPQSSTNDQTDMTDRDEEPTRQSGRDAQGHRWQRMQIIHDIFWDVMLEGYKTQAPSEEKAYIHIHTDIDKPKSPTGRCHQKATAEPAHHWRVQEMDDKAPNDDKIVIPLFDQFGEATTVLARHWSKGQW